MYRCPDLNSKYYVEKIINVLNRSISILKEFGWTTGKYARDKNGKWCPINSKRAVCFSAQGSIMRVLLDDNNLDRELVIQIFLNISKYSLDSKFKSISQFNDDVCTTISDVIKLFEKEIQRLDSLM